MRSKFPWKTQDELLSLAAQQIDWLCVGRRTGVTVGMRVLSPGLHSAHNHSVVALVSRWRLLVSSPLPDDMRVSQD